LSALELAALNDGSLVGSAIASTLGIALEGKATVDRAIVEHLASRRILLLLDNAEHLVSTCARIVDDVLHGCSGVKLLVTSRESLGVSGEHVLRVPSLSTPPAELLPDAETIARFESVQLFLDRVRSCQPDFCVTQ